MEWVTLTRKCQHITIMQHLLAIKQNCRQSYVLEINFPYVAFYVINKEYIISTISHVGSCFSMEDSIFHFICILVANWQSLEGILPCPSEWRTYSIFKEYSWVVKCLNNTHICTHIYIHAHTHTCTHVYMRKQEIFIITDLWYLLRKGQKDSPKIEGATFLTKCIPWFWTYYWFSIFLTACIFVTGTAKKFVSFSTLQNYNLGQSPGHWGRPWISPGRFQGGRKDTEIRFYNLHYIDHG